MIPLAIAALGASAAGVGGAQTGSDRRSEDGSGPRESVRVAIPRVDPGLTPYEVEANVDLMHLVYDTLTWRNPDGEPIPWLAETVEVGSDGLSVTVLLREGARWHDGRPLTAADVVFTYRVFRERPHPRFTPQLEAVESVAALDDRTVRFELKHPSLGFTDQPLADLPILPRHLWSGLGTGEIPAGAAVGSGPYRLVAEGDAGYSLIATRDYFRGRVEPLALVARPYRSLNQAATALTRRRVDLSPVVVTQAADFGLGVLEGPSYAGIALVLNTRRTPFSSPAARRAVRDALDLRQISGVAQASPQEDEGLPGARPADTGYVHPDSAWAPDDSIHESAPGAARAAFSRLGLAAITVDVAAEDETELDVGEQVAGALSRAGLEARVRPVSGAVLSSRVTAGEFDAALRPIPALGSYDPDFLRAVFGSVGSPLNESGYESPEFARASAEVASADDENRRRDAVARELALLNADAPAIALLFTDTAFGFLSGGYDEWVFVKGKGPLDKLSFLPASSTSPTTLTGAVGDDSSSYPLLGGIALALGALALMLAAVALRRGRR